MTARIIPFKIGGDPSAKPGFTPLPGEPLADDAGSAVVRPFITEQAVTPTQPGVVEAPVVSARQFARQRLFAQLRASVDADLAALAHMPACGDCGAIEAEIPFCPDVLGCPHRWEA